MPRTVTICITSVAPLPCYKLHRVCVTISRQHAAMRGSVLVTNTQMFVLVSRGVLYAVPVCATCRYTRIQQATSGHGRFNLRKRSSCQLKKRPGGPQGKSGRFGVTETSFPCPEVSMEYAGRVNTSLHTSARTVADCSAKCTCYQ